MLGRIFQSSKISLNIGEGVGKAVESGEWGRSEGENTGKTLGSGVWRVGERGGDCLNRRLRDLYRTPCSVT